ncbi:alpha/beta hydrolase fold domain-containing protein [Planctomonas deserti]|uniref:alpha/beta hydrolase fold domain-containing protein n=1 Tax=Planctomonas deserti TaxID=2144185 RepID=UPI000D3B7548|nr:alpha/beta hydrolase [Planctomonas deserti]
MTRTTRSVRSTLIRPAITLLGYQREFRSGERTLGGAMDRVVRPEPFAPPRFLDRSVRISARRVQGWPVYTVTPKAGRTHRRAVYAHGGAWVHEISFWHWRLVAELARATGTEFVVPIYPLVPLGTAGSVVPVFADLAEELVDEVGGEYVALLGDSAGGTIALATAMLLRDRGVPAPRDVVLIAPALDLSFTDPLIPRIQPTDPWLAVPGGRAAAERWRGELPLSDPLVSPIHGSLDGLGRITLFSGTHDILNADALALDRKARERRHPLDFHQVPNMLHVYPLLPIPEGAAARRAIAAVLTH